jgi:hypothetical protein
MSATSRRLSDILLILALCTQACLLAGSFYAHDRSVGYPVDALPVLLPLSDFHDLEPLIDREGFFRWTTGSSIARPPNPGGPLTLRLVMSSGFDSPTPLQLQVGTGSYHFKVGPGLHNYTLPVSAQPGARLEIRFNSPTINVEERELGIVLHRLYVAGAGGLPFQVGLALCVATLGGYALLRQAGLGRVPTGLILLALQIGAILWQNEPGWRYGFLPQLLLLAGAASLVAVLIEHWLPPIHPPTPAALRLSRNDGLALLGLLSLALLVCLPWLGAADPVGDLELSARRMWFLYESGLAEANTGGGDYMPVRIFILYTLAPLVALFNGIPGFWDPLPTATLTLIKLPSLLANLGTTALIYRWSRRVLALRGAVLIAAMHALMPPVWINIAWWGQVDALLIFPMLLAVVLIDRAGGRWSWLAWGTALLIKPQAIILAPLMYIVTLRRHGCRGLAQGGAIAGGLVVLALLPLALAGQGIGLYQAVAGSVGRFPLATNQAYNLWQLVTGGATVFDYTTGIGGISYRSIGFLLIGSVGLLVCATLLHRSDAAGRAAAAAVLALAFFALPTQIHERYAFFTLPFLALWIAYDRLALLPYLLIGVAATINIFGAIRGFSPDLSNAIRASALPNIVAIATLLLLAWLIARLLRQAFHQPRKAVMP